MRDKNKLINQIVVLAVILILLFFSLRKGEEENKDDHVASDAIVKEDEEEKADAEDEAFQKEMLKKYPPIKSPIDYNNNGIDDYADLVIGARKDAANHPVYDGAYVSENNGYSDSDIGVCTDVIWRAMKEAGYSMRSMLNADIDKHLEDYDNIENKPDPNIDFRRVKTLKPFYDKYLTNLEIKLTDPSQWQPGDIVIFETSTYKHIGILSDKRNRNEYPLVIHNTGQENREENFITYLPITGHYRFDASKIAPDLLIPWEEGEDGQ